MLDKWRVLHGTAVTPHPDHLTKGPHQLFPSSLPAQQVASNVVQDSWLGGGVEGEGRGGRQLTYCPRGEVNAKAYLLVPPHEEASVEQSVFEAGTLQPHLPHHSPQHTVSRQGPPADKEENGKEDYTSTSALNNATVLMVSLTGVTRGVDG